jgi:tRNA A37 N6-isopentenylltransferase MiaA
VSVISWLIAIALRAKKLRDLIMSDISSMVDKHLAERVKGLEKNIDEKLSGMQAGVVDEVWNRLDTIMKLKRIGEKLASDHENSQSDK